MQIQTERALHLLNLALSQDKQEVRFSLEVAALHLAKTVPEHWYTLASSIAQEAKAGGSDAQELEKDLKSGLKKIFEKARHHDLICTLRDWDVHREPLIDPIGREAFGVIRRGEPMHLSTGRNPNSVVGVSGLDVVLTGSGKRLGRKSYYQLERGAYLDEDSSEIVSLYLAVTRFLEDMPNCCLKAMELPDIKAYFEHPMRRPFPDFTYLRAFD